MDYPNEYLGEYKYHLIDPEEYDAIPEGTNLKFDGIIDGKPVIDHLRSKKPLRPQLLRFFIETRLIVSGIEINYEGPAFLRKGEKVIIWGEKQRDKFNAVKIETDDIIIQIS